MQVHGFPSGLHTAEDLRQPPHVAHAQDVDVVLAAESLDQGEVDLQRHILVVCSQQAQHHVVRIPGKVQEEEETVRTDENCSRLILVFIEIISNLRVERLCSLIHSHSDATLRQGRAQHLLQSLSHRVHPGNKDTSWRNSTNAWTEGRF